MKQLKQVGIRCEIDERDEKIGYKIRKAQLEKVPFMLVLGQKEQENKELAVRDREIGKTSIMSLEEFIDSIKH